MTTEETIIAPEPVRPSKRRKPRAESTHVEPVQVQSDFVEENQVYSHPDASTESASVQPASIQPDPVQIDPVQIDSVQIDSVQPEEIQTSTNLRKQRSPRRSEQQASNLREATMVALQEALSRTEAGHYSSALAVVDVATALLWTATGLKDDN